ncbi:hypothetical protein [Streptomyces sp. NPDC000888]
MTDPDNIDQYIRELAALDAYDPHQPAEPFLFSTDPVTSPERAEVPPAFRGPAWQPSQPSTYALPATAWNGEPCTAGRVTAVVADNGAFPEYWARDLVGTRRNAVQVRYGGEVFYLDDEDGSGWDKVTHGGGPGRAHRSLTVDPLTIELREDSTPGAEDDRVFAAGGLLTGEAYEALKAQWETEHARAQAFGAHHAELLGDAPARPAPRPTFTGMLQVHWPRLSGKRAAREAAAAEEHGTCDASTLGITDHAALGPCILRHRHDGPVHKDTNGATWWLNPHPVDELPTELATARAALARVRILHHPAEHNGQTICAECSSYDGHHSTDNPAVPYANCSTLAALAHPKDN